MTKEELGRGGWGVVKVAKFRGLRVAAKCLHQDLAIQPPTILTRNDYRCQATTS